jgi:hypothetical protein
LLDRLTEELANFFPVGMPGMRDKLQFTLSSSIGYDTNVSYASIDPQKSATAGVNGAISYKFGSPRFKVDAELTGGTTYYQNRPGGSNDNNYHLVLGVDYQMNPRLSFSFDTDDAYLSQPDPQLIGGIAQFSGSYYYTNTGFNLQYSLRPRWALTAGFRLSGIKYEDEAINTFSGYSQQTYSLGAQFLFSPRSTLTFEYRYNPIQYNTDGLGSDGHYLTFGINQTLSPKLTLGLSGGAEYRKLKNTTDNGRDSYLGPFFEGDLAYSAGPGFTIKGNMSFGTEPSGAASVSIRTSFRTGLSVSKTFAKHFELGLGLFYSRDENEQTAPATNYTQEYFTGNIDLRYRFTPAAALLLHYDYNSEAASYANGDYTRSFSSLGLELTF